MNSNPQRTFKSKRSTVSKILSIASNLTSPSYKPHAYILGGQPGSGKTNLHRKILIMHSTNVFLINGDDFRKYHPNFSKIQQIYGDFISFFYPDVCEWGNRNNYLWLKSIKIKSYNWKNFENFIYPNKNGSVTKIKRIRNKIIHYGCKKWNFLWKYYIKIWKCSRRNSKSNCKEHHLVVNSIVNISI